LFVFLLSTPDSFAVVTSHPLSQHRFASASRDGWGHPAGFVPLNAPPALYGPKTFTAGGGSLRAERPLVSLGRSTCDRACWGRLRSPSASAERSGGLAVRRLAVARRLCDGPRCDPPAGPKYRHLDRHHG
jgi:hypothetical protein